jgi:hypothetical protein
MHQQYLTQSINKTDKKYMGNIICFHGTRESSIFNMFPNRPPPLLSILGRGKYVNAAKRIEEGREQVVFLLPI